MLIKIINDLRFNYLFTFHCISISMVKWLIAVNRIQNTFCYIVCVYTVYIYVYINIYACIHVFKKKMLFIC